MARCQCLTKKGTGPQCLRLATKGSLFCKQHWNCQNQIALINLPMIKQQKIEKQKAEKQKAEKQEKFKSKFKFLLEKFEHNPNPDEILQLIKEGARPDLVKDSSGKTALIWAAIKGNLNAVNQLLKAGADPNVSDADGDTSLAWAAYKGHENIVKTLLDAGADPNIIGLNNRTPLMQHLHGSDDNGNINIVNLLLRAGSDLTIKDHYGNTTWSLAEENTEAIRDAVKKAIIEKAIKH